VRIGYSLSSEELGPRELVRQARLVAEEVPCGPDLERHVQTIQEFEDAGFDELYIQQIGPTEERFFEKYASEVLPRFAAHAPHARAA
jgi:hypothetical protein